MRNLASGIAFMAALNIACVTSAQSPVVSAGTSVKPGPENSGAYWKDRIRPLLERLENDRALAVATRARAEGLSADADTCFRVGLACEQYPEARKAPADYGRLLAVIDRDKQAVRDVEEEAHRVGARLASPRYRVRTGLH